MSEPRRDAKVFIADIFEAIQKIEMFTHEMTFEAFMKDERTKDAVVRNLEVIGEAVKNIPESIKERYRDLDWKAVTGMRDKLIHEYFGVSLTIVWETVKNDLPPFKKRLMEISKEMQE